MLLAGPVAALVIPQWLVLPQYPQAPVMLGIAAWMVLWWVSECVPLALTALVPLILFPLTGIASASEVAPRYMTSIMFLFIGGFLIAQAMERTGLHKRLALAILMRWHATPLQLVAGFLLATGFLSMWVSNTATTMLMVTIALAVLSRLDGPRGDGDKTASARFAAMLLLMIAYAANIGGISTPVGTVPNLVLLEIISTHEAALRPTFLQWMVLGVPLALVGLLLLWVIAAIRLRGFGWPAGESLTVADDYRALGVMRRDEKVVAVVSALAAIAWLTRNDISFERFTLPGWSSLLPYQGIDDGTVALAAAFILFLVNRSDGQKILTADAFGRLPWGVLILLGGGFALATGMHNSHLSLWLGESLYFLEGVPLLGVLLGVAVFMVFITELTSNTAITQVMLPILAAIAMGADHDMLSLMLTATFAASCAFMLPVATPPNAIVFATGRIPLQTMMRTGFALNLLMPLIIVSLVQVLRPALPVL